MKVKSIKCIFFTLFLPFAILKIDDPDVSLEKYDEREDGSLCFTMKIKSVPVPNLVQWKIKENNSETIQPLDFNDVDFKGTSHSFPNPVLVIKNKTILENCSFELEVQNRIGRKTGKNET